MNAREGFRRIGLLLGIIGAIVGIAGTWAIFNDLVKQHNDNVQYQKNAGEYWRILPKVRRAYPDKNAEFWDAAVAQYTQEKAALDQIGISEINVIGTHIISFKLTNGRYIMERPISPFDCLWPLTLPFIGFLVPWGTIKILFWIISGFTHRAGAV